jgi:zinc transporter
LSGFGFKVSDGVASRIPVEEAPDASGDLVWVHLSTNEEEAQAWLRDEAKLETYVIDALTATETRPRCEAVGEGAFLNLRGRTREEMDSSDLLASLRIWVARDASIR